MSTGWSSSAYFMRLFSLLIVFDKCVDAESRAAVSRAEPWSIGGSAQDLWLQRHMPTYLQDYKVTPQHEDLYELYFTAFQMSESCRSDNAAVCRADVLIMGCLSFLFCSVLPENVSLISSWIRNSSYKSGDDRKDSPMLPYIAIIKGYDIPCPLIMNSNGSH